MTATMEVVKLVSAYAVITIFSISVVILSAIIVHLAYYAQQLQKRKNKKTQSQIQFFILLTITAIVFFECTLILVIAVCLQIILIDAHALHAEKDWIHHVYYDAFEYMEYTIAICDTMAHLCVIFVFIARFQHTFHNSTIFGHEHGVLRALYVCTGVLVVFGVIIIALICIEHTVTEIIILEIIWEILVDIMCLWLLYLFMSKLYRLLKFSIQSHIQSGKKTNFMKELIEATKASLEQSKSDNKDSRSSKGSKGSRKSSKRSRKEKSMYTMTIDGMKVDPIKPNTGSKPGSANASPDPSPAPSPGPSVRTHGNMELTITTKALSDHEHTDNDGQTDDENGQSEPRMKGESAAMDLIGVMTKMTILVSFAVLMSVFGVIGNIFIEIEEMRYIEKHDIAIEELWADVIPVMDAVITSLMLYLQFNFTHKIYRYILGRLDVWFLTNCLKCIEYFWKRREGVDPATASFLIETQSTKTLETANATKSTETETV